MALALVVDSLDSVPEALRSEYTEADGKFRLNVEGVEDTSGLKSALKKERDAAESARKAAKAYADIGKSPDEIKALMESHEAAEQKRQEAESRREQAEREKAEREGDFKTLLDKAAKDAAKAKADYDKTLAEIKKERDELAKAREAAEASERHAVMNTRLLEALAKAGANDEGVKALPRLLSDRIKYDPAQSGDARFSFLSADGETPMAGKDATKPATWADLAQDAVSEYPSLFRGSGAGGGGKSPTSAGGAGKKTMTREQFNQLDPHTQMNSQTGPAEERVEVVD